MNYISQRIPRLRVPEPRSPKACGMKTKSPQLPNPKKNPRPIPMPEGRASSIQFSPAEGFFFLGAFALRNQVPQTNHRTMAVASKRKKRVEDVRRLSQGKSPKEEEPPALRKVTSGSSPFGHWALVLFENCCVEGFYYVADICGVFAAAAVGIANI